MSEAGLGSCMCRKAFRVLGSCKRGVTGVGDNALSPWKWSCLQCVQHNLTLSSDLTAPLTGSSVLLFFGFCYM